VVILSLWVYRLEHDEEIATEEELVMYNKVRELFEEEFAGVQDAKLSSIIARVWGGMMDEVVVWGITKLMGDSFRHHSQALVGYEDDIEASDVSTPSMISQGEEMEDSVY